MTLATGGTTVPTSTDAKQDAAPTKRCDTRKKMLLSAAQVMRERGAAGVTIDEVLARSGAPRGSVYYHFPNGRNQILTEALRYSGESITAMIDDADAASLAVMSIAALEGAIVLSRSTHSIDPLRQVGDQLEFLIKAKEFVVRNKLGQ